MESGWEGELLLASMKLMDGGDGELEAWEREPLLCNVGPFASYRASESKVGVAGGALLHISGGRAVSSSDCSVDVQFQRSIAPTQTAVQQPPPVATGWEKK